MSKSTVGRIVGGLPALFLLVDGAMKLVKPAVVIKGTTRLGYQEAVIVPLGIVLLVCAILYLIPRTAILGAILLTGYLGGAVASHARVGDLHDVPFPIVFGILLWGGLWLRDEQLKGILPARRVATSQ